MKRLLCAVSIVAHLGPWTPAALAQDAVVEERMRRLEKSVEDLQASNFKLRQDITALNARLEKVIEAAELTARRAGNNEDVLKLAQQLKELDQRRVADQQKILAEVEKMLKSVPVAPPAAPPGNGGAKAPNGKTKSPPKLAEPDGATPSPAADAKGVWHPIEKGQTLGGVVKAYNDDLKSKGKPAKVTLKAVLDANPKLNPDKMFIGQKIFIPIPEK
ncbi:MAG: LysM peptidoglycan-binding domain-containing protein [Verrucomicrobia bacterium]|nr:LysM peptidoglycan-binding domain-containing protein [Verrucomicrobiota bacterium]